MPRLNSIKTAKSIRFKFQQPTNWFFSHLPLISVICLLFVLPFLGGSNELFGVGLLLSSILSAGTITLAWQIRKQGNLRLCWSEVALLTFVSWQWLTLSFSVYRWATMLEATRWVAFAVIFMSVRRLSSDSQKALWIAFGFTITAILSALQGIHEYAFALSAEWRIFGPFLNPNLFANYLLIAFFLSVSVAAIYFNRSALFILAPIFLLIPLGLTASKGALLSWLLTAFSLSVTVMWWKVKEIGNQWKSGMWKLVFISVLLLAVLALSLSVLSFLLFPQVKMRFTSAMTQQAHSWMFRWLMWKATTVGILTNPVWGFGAGTFELVYPQFATTSFTRHAHNGFLQVAIESGLVGLFLLILSLSPIFINRCRQQNQKNIWLQFGSISSALAFCLHNFVETAWLTVANLLSLAVVCGIATSTMQCIVTLRKYWQAALLIPMVFGIWHSINIARGDYFAKQAKRDLSFSGRLYWLQKASLSDPLNARHKIDQAILLETFAEAMDDEARLQEAIRLCDEAIRLQPTRSGNYKVKARLLEALRDWRNAELSLRTAYKLNRTDTEALLRLGQLLEERGKVNEAVRIYRNLISLEKNPYGKYKPIEQWQDIYIASGKVRLANWLSKNRHNGQARRLLIEAKTMLEGYRKNYLPLLKAAEPETAESHEAFIDSLTNEIERVNTQLYRKGKH